MLKGEGQTIFRVVIGLVFLGVGIKYFIGSEYLWGVVSFVAGVAFIASIFLKKNGKKG